MLTMRTITSLCVLCLAATPAVSLAGQSPLAPPPEPRIFDPFTPFELALARRDLTEAIRLIQTGIDPNTSIRYSINALQLAVLKGDKRAVRELLALGADANLPYRTWSPLLGHSARDLPRFTDGATPLSQAVEQGDPELIALLLEAKPALDAPDQLGRTALTNATRRDDRKAALLLLNAGAKVDLGLPPPLLIAAGRGDREMVRLLLGRGSPVDLRDQLSRTALMLAAARSDVPLLTLLLQRGASPTTVDHLGHSALVYAVSRGSTPVARLLLQREPEGRVHGQIGKTALLTAVDRGSLDLARLLLRSGASVTGKNERGDSVLHLAVRSGQPELYNLLHKRGAPRNIRNRNGYTPLHEAVLGGAANRELVLPVLRSHPDLDSQDEQGRTALMLAAGQWPLVQDLLRAGADPRVRDRAGRTALTYALQINDHRSASALRAAKQLRGIVRRRQK